MGVPSPDPSSDEEESDEESDVIHVCYACVVLFTVIAYHDWARRHRCLLLRKRHLLPLPLP